MTEAPLITFENAAFSYDGTPVLEDVTLSIGAHEFACIVGPNGGGKTTLLKLMLGLLEPTAGRVRVFGDAPAAARRRIGYMPQHLQYDPMFPVSALDVALMGRLGRAAGPYSRKDREAVREALEEMRVDHLGNRLFSTLSGGQRQRVLIARALAAQPDLLLLDEPTANVDLRAEEQFFEMLQELNRRMAILIVSHDLGFVSGKAKSVICVNRRVVVHPTSELTGDIIRDIYGGDVRMVRHDHRCAEEGHERHGIS